MISLGVFSFIRYRAQQPPFRLIAGAYTANRTLELRVGNARYGPLRNERGPSSNGSSRPYMLLESQARIRQHLDRDPDDPAWLLAEGRTEILEWQYAGAIETLKKARDLVPAGSGEAPEILVDLATAYYQRAEATNRPIDYSMASDLLGKAIQKNPRFAIAYFNRAIVYEKQHLYDPAIQDWQDYLKFDSNSDWATEARRRLANLRDKMKRANSAIPKGSTILRSIGSNK
jgi:tetratricopeptide (TPR) repeat protein